MLHERYSIYRIIQNLDYVATPNGGAIDLFSSTLEQIHWTYTRDELDLYIPTLPVGNYTILHEYVVT